MKKPLRVLFVEDSADDAQILERVLRQGGFDLSSRRVDCAEDMAKALDSGDWDVIISDHVMPGFGSLHALKLFQTRHLDIPFIIVSGAIGEDVAVAVMKAGANDYVMKSNLARLAPSIEREMREAASRRARRKAEEALARSQQALAFLAAIVKSSDDAIIGNTLDGTILSWNAGAETMYGYSEKEMVGRTSAILSPPYRPEELPQFYEKIKRGEQIKRYETVRLRKDGVAIDVSLTLSPIRDTAGNVIGVSAIERNISERKHEEAEHLKLIDELTVALAGIKTLRGLLPICASCKRIRDDRGYWERVESYIERHSEAEFTHGICPDCLHHLYPEYSAKS
jgi:two-component system cell cycle sensor histidine kinase/response regulator CckA